MTIFWIVAGVIILLALVAVGMYNGLITLKNRVDEAWSDIDVQLKRPSKVILLTKVLLWKMLSKLVTKR